MRFHCEKSIILSAASTAARAAAVRNVQPSIEGLLFVADDQLTITGYDLEVGINVSVYADIEKKGAVIMPNKMLLDILRKMPDETITFDVDSQQTITIKCGIIEFSLPGLPSSEYPNMPEMINERHITLPQGKLKYMLQRITYALSDNESRILNTGALFDVVGQTLNIVALDGYRMAIRRTEIDYDGEDFKFIVPGNALRELEKTLSDDNDSAVSIELGRRHIQFMLGQATLVSRLLEGEFHNYARAIPDQYKYKIRVRTRELQTAVERVSLLIHEKIRSPIRLVFGQDKINLSCQTALGRGFDQCSCEEDGEELEIGFNNRYLLDSLRTVDDEWIDLGLSGSLNPCCVMPLEGQDFLNMVLPTRLRND